MNGDNTMNNEVKVTMVFSVAMKIELSHNAMPIKKEHCF